MADYTYKANKRPKTRKYRRIRRLIIFLVLVALIFAGYLIIKDMLKPQTVIKQSKSTERKITYNEAKVKRYELPDFTIDIPASWTQVARPTGPYQVYGWQTSEAGTNGQLIEVYEDTIPPNYGYNRALIVSGQDDHLNVEGTASDNCEKYTKKQASTPGQISSIAKWQGVDFLCDLGNTSRDVIGTSSTDGVNIVILKNTSTGAAHKFLFSYTNHGLNSDYNVFYQALRSFKTQ